MDTRSESGKRGLDVALLFRRYGPMVHRRCRQLLGDAASSEDAMQTVFVKLVEKRPTLRADNPLKLLWRMATNHCLNVIRDRAVRNEVTNGDALLSTIACSDELEDRICARDLLRKLFGGQPKSSRMIAVLMLGGIRLRPFFNPCDILA